MTDDVDKIVHRIGGEARESVITEIYRHLKRSERAGGHAEGVFQSKEAETKDLIVYATTHNLWYDFHQFSVYLDEGAEQKVFLDAEKSQVLKLNDGIFYVNWTQYIESLIVHNLLFPSTAYELVGFVSINSTLHTAVTQRYIKPTEPTNIESVKQLMRNNGFEIKRNNDYLHDELGLIIEDLHEENVLTHDGVLFFIDTVIYLKN